MQLSELRTRLDQFLMTDLDSYYGIAPSSANKDSLINEALRMIARYVRPHFKKVTLTVSTNDQRIRLDNTSKLSRVMFSIDSDAYVSASNRLAFVPFPEFDRITDWRFGTSGTPQMFSIDQAEIVFERPWSAGQTLYVDGYGLYLTLAQDADVPELPVYAHEAIAYLASILAAEPSVTDSVALNRLALYNNRWMDAVDDVRRQVASNEIDLRNFRL